VTVLRGRSGNLGALSGESVPQQNCRLSRNLRGIGAVFREASTVVAAVRGRPDAPEPVALSDARLTRAVPAHAALAAVEGAGLRCGVVDGRDPRPRERFWLSEAITRDAVPVRLPRRGRSWQRRRYAAHPNANQAARETCERSVLGRPRDGHDDALLELLHHV